MDEATFQKELSKYKVVRRADHYKIRFNKKVLLMIPLEARFPFNIK